MAKRITKAEKIAAMSPEELAKYKGLSGDKQLRSYLSTLRAGYKRRVGSFSRKGLVSYAQISFEKSAPNNLKGVPLTKMNRNQLLLEIARYSKFFNDVTSTEKGIRETNYAQDRRIFGTDYKGRPLYTMTQKEREEYWDFYDEFKNQFPEWSTQPFSESVQQSLAEAIFEDPDFENATFTQKLRIAREHFELLQDKESMEDGPNVLSGRWTGFEK